MEINLMKLDSKKCLIIFSFKISYFLASVKNSTRVKFLGTQPLRKAESG
jgi:hypothetical protein